MNKPIKPAKKVMIRGQATFYFDWVSNKVSLNHFLDWVKEKLPKGAEDITLELKEDPYDTTGLELAWNKLVKNSLYDKEMKKYQKQLARWKDQ